MKVGNIVPRTGINIDGKSGKSKLDFSDSFNQTNKSKTKEELDGYMKEIKILVRD